MSKRIVHITTHYIRDTRIFFRECLWAKRKNNYDITIIAPHTHDETIDGISIRAIGKVSLIPWKFVFWTFHILKRTLEQKFDLYHIQAPTLVPAGLFLRIFLRKKVIFDVEENIVDNISEKKWLIFPKALANIYKLFDLLAIKYFHIILAETSYLDNYKKTKNRLIVLLNMPDYDFFKNFQRIDRYQDHNVTNHTSSLSTHAGHWGEQLHQKNKYEIFYIGGISADRCIYIVLEALALLKNEGKDFHFHCIGEIDPDLLEEVNRNTYYQQIKSNITFYGRLPVNQGFEISKYCHIGLSLLMPTKNYFRSYPTKIFEYMAVGLPFITSNFPLYEDVVLKYQTGLCVNPHDPNEVFQAMQKLLGDRKLAEQMSHNGIKIVQSKYNWANEYTKLEKLYSDLLA